MLPTLQATHGNIKYAQHSRNTNMSCSSSTTTQDWSTHHSKKPKQALKDADQTVTMKPLPHATKLILNPIMQTTELSEQQYFKKKLTTKTKK
jgi:hypothetical protein